MKLMDLFCAVLIVATSNFLLFNSSFAITEQDKAHYNELHNSALLGEIPTDLALGAAALKMKLYDEALFTYDRVLINSPQNRTALLGKLEILVKLSQFGMASSLAQHINQLPLNAEEKERLHRLERKITYLSKLHHQLSSSVSFGLDNNASIASSDSTDEYQALLEASYYFGSDFPVSDYTDYYTKANEKCASPYLRPNLNYSGSYQLLPQHAITWNFGFDRTQFLRYSHFNVTHLQYKVGFFHNFGRFSLQESFYSQSYLFDGKRYRDIFLGLFSLGYLINNHNLVQIYGEEGQLIYPHYRRSNVYSHTGGIEWHHFHERYAVNLRWFYNRHQAKNYDDEPKNYAARHAYGAYLAGKFNFTCRWAIGGEFLYQYSNYDSYRPIFNKRRRDNFYDANISLHYRLNQYCDLYLKGEYSINNSNYTGYSYRHFISSTGINFKI